MRYSFFIIWLCILTIGCQPISQHCGQLEQATYSMGWLTAPFEYSMDTIFKATEKSLEELGLAITRKSKDGLEIRLTVRDSRDDKITVKIGPTDDSTLIWIKAGILGNKRKSQLIYQQIVNNLNNGDNKKTG